jgi:hypothetical protein
MRNYSRRRNYERRSWTTVWNEHYSLLLPSIAVKAHYESVIAAMRNEREEEKLKFQGARGLLF